MSAAMKWTIVIVVLLAGNIAAMVFLAAVASATSPDIVPDYYNRAARYDDAIDEAARSRALGWSTEVQLARTSVEVSVRDKNGSPLDGAVVRVSGYPRAHATRTIDVTLVASGPGTYRATVPETVGVHDLTVVVEHRSERFTTPAIAEAR
jgi:nitrogen fixation protein FixH